MFLLCAQFCDRSDVNHSPKGTNVLSRTGAVIAACAAAVGLQFATAPISVAAPAVREYVALGDSWSADVTLLEIDGSQASPFCAQSTGNYPKQVAAALGVQTFRDATCGSAKTTDMTRPQPVPDPSAPLAYNPPQFDRLTPTTDLVTIGIGGNDAGLADVIKSCVSPAGAHCTDQWVVGGVDTMSALINETEQKVVGVLDGIHARSPHARILFVGYLAGISPGAGCVAQAMIPDSDLMWVGEKLVELNRMAQRAAAAGGAEFVDTYSSSIGHDMCQAPGVRWVEGTIPMSSNPQGPAIPFHPNQLGADHQAAMVKAALGL